MKKILFITDVPSFYKVNLYNELQKEMELEVVFLVNKSDWRRTSDFYAKEMNFKVTEFVDSSEFAKILAVAKILMSNKYDRIVYTGWSKLIFILFSIFTSKNKNCTVIESSYIESETSGLKAIIKRMFLSRISRAYVSGESQKKLAEQLHFKGDIIKTYGVGIMNYTEQPQYRERSEVSRFIYVGRLSPEKNLEFLINYFNQHPELKLTIVGFGPQEKELKRLAKANINFSGAIENKQLPAVYQVHDVFILPSKSEPWGLVVEEALNNGLPCIVSDKVGCAEEIIKHDENGYTFELRSTASLDKVVKSVCNCEKYNKMSRFISQTDINSLKRKQAEAYLQ